MISVSREGRPQGLGITKVSRADSRLASVGLHSYPVKRASREAGTVEQTADGRSLR